MIFVNTWYVIALYDVGHTIADRCSQLSFARCHVEWAKRSLESWEEAKAEVNKIEVR